MWLFSNRIARPIGKQSHAMRRRLNIESLEERRQFSVSVADVHLVEDTGASATDLITSNPTFTGTVSGFTVAANTQVEVTDSAGGSGTATVNSDGTFTYDPVANNGSLTSYEGGITFTYVAVETDGSGNVIDSSASNTFSITLDNVAPTLIADNGLYSLEDTGENSINLAWDFSDGTTDPSQIVFGLVDPGDTSLLSSVTVDPTDQTLTWASVYGHWGNTTITVSATDLAGNTSNVTFNLLVDVVIPAMVSFSVVENQQGQWYAEGSISDPDPFQCVVEFGGLLDGFSAEVADDQSYSILLPDGEYGPGIATAEVVKAGEFTSNTVMTWVTTT